jgi:hypothetical protein
MGTRVIAFLAALFAWSGVGHAEEVVRLRAIDPKPFYKPGDKIVFEMRCRAGVTDAMIMYNPTLQDGDAGAVLDGDPKCPFSRFEIEIPRDFIGKNRVWIRREHLPPNAVTFEFEVKSDVHPSDLWFSTDTQNEGCNFFYLRDGLGPQDVGLFSVVPDGTRFDLCREGKASLRAIPPDHGVFAMKDGVCTLTLKKKGDLKVVVSYRGLRKEWTCTEAGPSAAAPPRKSDEAAKGAR